MKQTDYQFKIDHWTPKASPPIPSLKSITTAKAVKAAECYEAFHLIQTSFYNHIYSF